MHLFQSRPPSHLPLNFFTGIIQRPLTFTRFKAKLLISLLPSEPTSFHSLALKDGSRFFPIQSEIQGPLWQSYIHSVSPIILSPKYLLHLCTSLVTYHHSPSFPSWPPILVRLQQKQLTLKKEPLLTFQMKRTPMLSISLHRRPLLHSSQFAPVYWILWLIFFSSMIAESLLDFALLAFSAPSFLSICWGDWFQEPRRTLKFTEAQIPYIKWCSIWRWPIHIFPHAACFKSSPDYL